MLARISVQISIDNSHEPLKQCGEDCPFNDNFEYCQLFGVPMDREDEDFGGRSRQCVNSEIEG